MNEIEKDIVILQRVLKEWTREKACQGEYARDINGAKAYIDSPAAVRWCALGFTLKVENDEEFITRSLSKWTALFNKCIADMPQLRGLINIAEVNDINTLRGGHVRARKVLRKALEHLQTMVKENQ